MLLALAIGSPLNVWVTVNNDNSRMVFVTSVVRDGSGDY